MWGVDWVPLTQTIRYESLINIRPPGNRSMEILAPELRTRTAEIVQILLGGV